MTKKAVSQSSQKRNRFKKWLWLHWIKLISIIIFVVFMGIYQLGYNTLNHCVEDRDTNKVVFPCDSSNRVLPYSSIDIRTHILSGPEATMKNDTQLIEKEVPIKDADGNTLDTTKITEPIKNKDGNLIKITASDTPTRKIMAERFGRQIIWTLFVCLNVLLGLVGLTIFFMISYRSVKLKYIFICLGACLFFSGFSAFGNYSPVIEPVIARTIEATKPNENVGSAQEKTTLNYGYLENRSIVPYFRFINVVYVVRFVNFVAETIAIATPFAMAAVLFQKPKRRQRKQERLLEQVFYLRVILYTATVLLVIGVLRMGAVLNWAAAFLPVNSVDAANSFFATFTFVIGASYSILLALVYLPPYFYLQSRADSLITRPAINKNDMTSPFKTEFLQFSFATSLPHILAIVAPFLTGAASEIFTGLFSK